MKNLLLVVFYVFLTIFGSFATLWNANVYIRERNSKNWPTTIATVMESRITEPASASTGARFSRGGGASKYCPMWTYEFYIDSKKYSSSRGAFGSSSGSLSCYKYRTEAESELKKYPVGSTVKAIYNPDDPSVSALNLVSSSYYYLMSIIVPVFCIFLGVMNLTTFFKSTNKENQLNI